MLLIDFKKAFNKVEIENLSLKFYLLINLKVILNYILILLYTRSQIKKSDKGRLL